MSKPVRNGSGWRVRWLDEQGKRQSKTLGSYKEAELELVSKKHESQLIRSGKLEKVFEDKKFSDLSEYYFEKVIPTKRSQKDIASIIKSQLLPFFGRYHLKYISQEHAQDYIILKTKNGVTKKTISNHLTVLISMLNFSRDMNWLRIVPKIRKPKIPKTSVYSYLKTDEEITILLKTARQFGEMNYYLYAVAVFTGMRAGELAGLTWEDVDLSDSRTIRVKGSFGNPTKSGEIRFIPILDPLLPILNELKVKRLSNYLFISNTGTMINKSARIFQEQFKTIQMTAGFPVKEVNGKKKYYVRFHDLRHTFASHWMMKNGDIYRLQKVLGHQSVEMTQRYSHLASHVFKEDYSRFNSINLN